MYVYTVYYGPTDGKPILNLNYCFFYVIAYQMSGNQYSASLCAGQTIPLNPNTF